MDNIRFKQRFENFEKAQTMFDEMIMLIKSEPNNKAYKMAVIQAFEMSMELAWKTLKDYLNYLQYNVQSPREVIKQAFAIEIIENGEVWLSMLEDRNLTSHAYDETKADEIVNKIVNEYYKNLNEIKIFFKGKVNE